MDFYTNAFLSLAVGIGALIGWIRFREIDPAFRPFLYLVWAGFFHESISILLLYLHYSTVVFFNVFLLAEALLLCWQFRCWETIERKTATWLAVFLFCWWTAEWLLTSLTLFSSYFLIGYSVITLLLSTRCINRLLFEDASPLFRNPVFLLCTSFLLYFGFSVLVEVFWMTDLKNSKVFRLRIHALLCYVNLFTNLVFALAILWMPTRFRSIIPF